MMGARGRIIFAVAGLLVLGLLIALYTRQPASEDAAYIFDRATGPAIDQVRESQEPFAAIKGDDATAGKKPMEEATLKNLFSQIIVGSGTTLHYFTWLGHEFRHATSREDHLAQVKDRIFSQFPAEEAGQLFATYQRYLDCEMGIADLTASFGPVTTVEDGLELLRTVQKYRRDFLGTELADRLFGEQVKEKEYSIRRAAIINDRALYAKEKQEQLDRLTQEMWGETANPEAVLQEKDAYGQYRDALAIHQKDLDETAGDDERRAAIDDIRNQYLPPDAIERIRTMEQQQAQETQQEQAYYAKEKRIAEDTTLSEDERAEQIEQLRQEMLGSQAEAMKRREAIEKARKALLDPSESSPEARP
jgi:lipase chaperone LimK